MTEPLDTRREPCEAPYWNRSRIALVVLVYIMALAVAPLAHSYLSITGVLTEPDTLDDFACLSCHAANRGHIVPPDRSCLSCHPMDFDRHLATTREEMRMERVGSPFGVLVGAYAAFCLGALLFVLKPLSPARMILVILSVAVLGGTVASLFGSLP